MFFKAKLESDVGTIIIHASNGDWRVKYILRDFLFHPGSPNTPSPSSKRSRWSSRPNFHPLPLHPRA